MYLKSTRCFVLAALLVAAGCGGPKVDLTHLLVAGDRIGVVVENELSVSLNSKENEPVTWPLSRFSGEIESWDAEGLKIAVDDADVPEGILDSFSSDRNRLVLDIARAGGRSRGLNVSFEPIGESVPGVVVRDYQRSRRGRPAADRGWVGTADLGSDCQGKIRHLCRKSIKEVLVEK